MIGKTTANLGADGMAFWYTKQPGPIGTNSCIFAHQLGPVFGNKDRWQGIGIIFDTFDNDNMVCEPLGRILTVF